MRPVALVPVFVFLNAIDALTTAWLVTHGAGEVNPVMASVLSLGTGAFLTFKVSLAALLAGVLMRFFTSRPLKALCVAFSGIAAWQATLCLTL